MLDRARFPTASEYFDSLPLGFDSFAQCRVRALVYEPLATDFPELARAFPEGPLGQLLRRELNPNQWIPEVVGQVANLMVRDAFLTSDTAFLDWTFRANERVFDKPLVRTLMRLLSPTLLVIGAARRWSTLHDGSLLSSTPVAQVGQRLQTVGQLRFPEGLFHPVFLQGLTAAFRAALALARGREISVLLGRCTSQEADYVVSWAA